MAELKRLHIYADENPGQKIPAMDEVFEVIGQKLKEGLLLNIELKTSVWPYPGIEEKIIEMVHRRGFQENMIYSSFSALTLERVRELDKEAEIGILDNKVSDCLFKLKGGCGVNALHPCWKGIDLPAEKISGYSVRAYFSGHLYPEKPTGTRLDLGSLEERGITDVFLNEPEMYCGTSVGKS